MPPDLQWKWVFRFEILDESEILCNYICFMITIYTRLFKVGVAQCTSFHRVNEFFWIVDLRPRRSHDIKDVHNMPQTQKLKVNLPWNA